MTTPLPLVIGNWKMNMLASQACDMAQLLVGRLSEVKGVEVVIAPPFTSLYPVGQIIKGSQLGLAGQNFYFASKGAYTGEVSLEMLRDVGCDFALIGHSERRSLFGENDAAINKKVHRAIQMGITAVVCVGETLEQRKAGATLNIIETQLSKGLAGLSGERLSTENPQLWLKMVQGSRAELIIAQNDSKSRLAPPTNAPSICSSCKSCLLFSGFTLPP